MELEQIFFWLLALGATLTSILVVLPPGGKNPLYGALALILSFFFVAGLYVLLVAHLMAALQIMVYAGAIMVLFTFVIMLLNLSKRELGEESKTIAQGLGVAAMLVITVKAVLLVEASADGISKRDMALDPGFGTVEAVGDLLFKEYLFPFELAAVLLLVAIVGAIVLAKRTL